MSSSKWFYTHNGKDKPRVTLSQLVELFRIGKINCSCYVWHKSYCQSWTPINQVSMIMNEINEINAKMDTKHTRYRSQPSIIRGSNVSHSKNSFPNLPNLPKNISTSNTSNNTNHTSSEIQEIIGNDFGGQMSESSDMIPSNHKPHIIDYNNYGINQLVQVSDPMKVGICYGIIVDIRGNQMIVKYNNKAYGTQWFELGDSRVSIVSMSDMSSSDASKRKSKKSHVHKSRKRSSITDALTQQRLSLLSQRKLFNLEKDEFDRAQEKFYYQKKKHETELWAVKNDYIEQTKKLKKQYLVYKQACHQMQSAVSTDAMAMVKYHKLDTREKLLRDSQRCVDKKQKSAQILYQTSTHLLQKVQTATSKLHVYSKLCDEKCQIESQLIKKQEIDHNKYVHKISQLREEMAVFQPRNMDKLHKQLIKTYETLREERRKFLPVQRKWAKLIAKHQTILREESALANIKSKLENLRKYEAEYRLGLVEEIKKKMNIDSDRELWTEKEIMSEYRQQLLQDRERQIINEKKLLRLQARHLEESLIEFECEREAMQLQLQMQMQMQMQSSTDGSVSKNKEYPMRVLTQQFESMMALKDEELKKMETCMNEWKSKYAALASKTAANNDTMEELSVQNKELQGRLEELEYRNDSLSEQIKEMIITSDEASEAIKQIQPLLERDEESNTILSDTSDYDETAAALSSIRTKLNQKGPLMSKHESQHSMTAIVDLVKKTSKNMAIVNDSLFNDSFEDENDSFSDHLGIIENIIKKSSSNTDTNQKKLNIYLSNDSGDSSNNESGTSSAEPPIFWNHNNTSPTDTSILQRMISNPNQVLENVISPNQSNQSVPDMRYKWSDEEDSDNGNKKKVKNRKRCVKKKRRKSNQNISDKKYNKKRRSKKLGTQELLFAHKEQTV